MKKIFLRKISQIFFDKIDAKWGGWTTDLSKTLNIIAKKPFELNLELTNHCNANCVFCPYEFQVRKKGFMSDQVFEKAILDFAACGGGAVGLTPIVGESLMDPKFLKRVKYLRQNPKIDRIFLTTNAILIDKFGCESILKSGLTSITISTAGFEADSYQRIYSCPPPVYERMRKNVLDLLAKNEELGKPVQIAIGIRSDRPLRQILKDPDMKPILEFNPVIDFTWSFTTAGGRITRDRLPAKMRIRRTSRKIETCVSLYNGPMVLSDGQVLGCGCVAAMDASKDLGLGSLTKNSIQEIYQGKKLYQLRKEFGTNSLNQTCQDCKMYRNLDLYRTRKGRYRAKLNQDRFLGKIVSNRSKFLGRAFDGG